MKPQGSAVERPSPGTWAEFSAWAAFGAAAGFGLVVFGTFAAVPILIGVGLAATRPALRRSWFGAVAGVGAMSLYVAYAQRRGPGTVCWQTATASGCDQYHNPLPWLVMGAALVIAGLVGHTFRLRAR